MPFSMERNMSNLKHNEKMKLTAAFYNNLGVASLTASWLVPLISMPKSGFVDVTIFQVLQASLVL
jgi:hypothetical protein